MKKITLSLPDEVADEMEATAKAYGLSRSGYVSMCIKQQMAQDSLMKQLPQLTLVMEEAIKEVKLKRIEADAST